jgi:hypothetical protein
MKSRQVAPADNAGKEASKKARYPNPPVPATANMKHLSYMMVDVAVVREGEMASKYPPEVCWWNMQARAAAWHQVPAGSLPNDERMLARLLGFGSDVNTFRTAKRLGCLTGFNPANDGRLYHEEVVKMVKGQLDVKESNRQRVKPAQEASRLSRARQAGKTSESKTVSEKPCASSETTQPVALTDAGTESIPLPESFEITANSIRVTATNRREGNRIEEKVAAAAASVDQPMDRSRMPRLSDPLAKWSCLTSEYFLDAEGRNRPTINGYYLDGFCASVCKAAGIKDPNARYDWDTVVRWLHAGISTNTVLDAIEERAATRGYKPPAALRYFDGLVREYHIANPGQGRRRDLN